MKIVAFNGSPRGKRSNTDRILQPFLEGAREAGAETEAIYLKDKQINYCQGCFTCWAKTPGVCIHKDDMPALLEKMLRADIVVYATPLYIFSVTAQMKAFMDRHIPSLDPHIVKLGDHYIHPTRYETAGRRVVLISNCGFPERHHFDALVETFRLMTDGPNSELIGTILCPAGELLHVEALQGSLRWYFDAARQAGREIVQMGHITAETQATLDRDLVPLETYVMMANASWDGIRRPSTHEGAADSARGTFDPNAEPGQPLSPPDAPPTTLRETIAGMPLVFQPTAAGDLVAILQFDVSGEEPGLYYLRIADGACKAFEGRHPQPTLTVDTPSEVWLAISRGELDGAMAMIQGRYTIEGDLGLLMRMGSLFGSA
jgi:multimeric flavodoxin WrbA